MEGLQFVISSFQNYMYGNRIWLLYPVALVIILLLGGKDGRRIFLYPLLAQLLTIFNPLVARFMEERLGFGNRYLRMFWMLEYYVVIAYACVLLARRAKRLWGKGLVMAACMLAIVLTGTPVFSGEGLTAYVMASNQYFTDNEYLPMRDILHAGQTERPSVVMPDHMIQTYRTYDPAVTSVINRVVREKLDKYQDLEDFRAHVNFKKNLKIVLRVYWYGDTTVPYETFCEAARKRKIDYFVLLRSSGLNDYMLNAGLVCAGETPSYVVWQVQKAG